MTREKKENVAIDAAHAFRKVAHLNTQGMNAAWVTFWAKSQEGMFLRASQAATIAAQAAAIIAVGNWAKGVTK